MPCDNHGCKAKMGDSVSMQEFQEALRLGKNMAVPTKAEGYRAMLSELEVRLRRVRSWGGPYTAIEFSPYVQTMLEKSSSKLPSQVITI